jgi:C4-dicarboxylate-specific signal transduction histidine kinase
MTASIAHEVNQPLSGIISNAGAGERFIDRGNVNLEQLREILVDIGADGRRAYNVMQNIRNTVKRGGAIRERLSINDVVTHVAHLIQPDAAAHSCRLKISLADKLPAVDGDAIQIQQVLVNLIGNAFDSMRETALENRNVEVSTKRNGDQTIVLSVRDHGVGIDEGVRSRIFEQFFTTKEDGLGMGLAIVRSIIQAHEGSIVAENAPGGGACFSVTLPVSNRAAP